MDAPEIRYDGPKHATATVSLAHGAGAPMDSPFMNVIAEGLAQRGIRVARFEFPYMAERRETGKKRGPNPAGVLEQCWRTVVAALGGGDRVVIGGKSLGGRIASMIADEVAALGLICLGYPFHPPGRPDKLRTSHLERLKTPTLVLQGERDPFGTPDDVAGYRLSRAMEVVWLADGDHSFKPRKSSGRTLDENLGEAIDRVARFVDRLRAP